MVTKDKDLHIHPLPFLRPVLCDGVVSQMEFVTWCATSNMYRQPRYQFISCLRRDGC